MREGRQIRRARSGKVYTNSESEKESSEFPLPPFQSVSAEGPEEALCPRPLIRTETGMQVLGLGMSA